MLAESASFAADSASPETGVLYLTGCAVPAREVAGCLPTVGYAILYWMLELGVSLLYFPILYTFARLGFREIRFRDFRFYVRFRQWCRVRVLE